MLIELIEQACRLGASDAAVVPSHDISVDEELSMRCEAPRCENYGCSPGCPPHVGGPSQFRQLLTDLDRAVVFKIDVPSAILLSAERCDIFGLLHEIAAGVEQSAHTMGYGRSRAYAGGSCKQIFCREHATCRVLAAGGDCRNPQRARPSMSGFGVNVPNLMQRAGWTMNWVSRDGDTSRDPMAMSTLCGLVLIG